MISVVRLILLLGLILIGATGCEDALNARPTGEGYCHDWYGHYLCDRTEDPAARGMRDHWIRSDLLLPPILPEELPEPETEPARLMTAYCIQCHNLAAPAMHAAEDWPPIVQRMRLRMEWMAERKSSGGIRVPTKRELRLILGYLKKYSQRAISPDQMPEPKLASARTFRRVCARCHALPDPTQHTVAEWPGVVERMMHYMRRGGRDVPGRGERAELLRYLTRHASPPR